MLKQLIKLAAYSAAPRAAFAVSHPKSAVKLKKAEWDMKHALAPRVAAVGAAALALPLGYAMGKVVGKRSRKNRLRHLTGYTATHTVRDDIGYGAPPPQSPASAPAREGVHES